MTERKPGGMGFEDWIDRQIREARERGAFDDLPGEGKPIPDLDQPYDEMRWVSNWVRRETGSGEVLLPTGLKLRKEIEDLDDTVRDLGSEDEVRAAAEELNERIERWIRTPDEPRVVVVPVKVDEVVDRWRAERASRLTEAADADDAADAPVDSRAGGRLARWWRQRVGRW